MDIVYPGVGPVVSYVEASVLVARVFLLVEGGIICVESAAGDFLDLNGHLMSLYKIVKNGIVDFNCRKNVLAVFAVAFAFSVVIGVFAFGVAEFLVGTTVYRRAALQTM